MPHLDHFHRWSATEGSRKQGHPEIQVLLARAYYKGMEYKQAAKHYLHAEKPEEFAEFLLAWSKEGYPSESDLYIARSVLQYGIRVFQRRSLNTEALTF